MFIFLCHLTSELSWIRLEFGFIGCVLVISLILKQQSCAHPNGRCKIKSLRTPPELRRTLIRRHLPFKAAYIVQRGELRTYPGSISSVVSVESQHQYVLRSQSSRVSTSPHSSGLKTLKKPCSRGTLHFCSSVNLPWSTVSLCCGVHREGGVRGMNTANECNATCHFLTSNRSRNDNNQTLRFILRGFLLAVWKVKVDLSFECHVKQRALWELVWHL